MSKYTPGQCEAKRREARKAFHLWISRSVPVPPVLAHMEDRPITKRYVPGKGWEPAPLEDEVQSGRSRPTGLIAVYMVVGAAVASLIFRALDRDSVAGLVGVLVLSYYCFFKAASLILDEIETRK